MVEFVRIGSEWTLSGNQHHNIAVTGSGNIVVTWSNVIVTPYVPGVSFYSEDATVNSTIYDQSGNAQTTVSHGRYIYVDIFGEISDPQITNVDVVSQLGGGFAVNIEPFTSSTILSSTGVVTGSFSSTVYSPREYEQSALTNGNFLKLFSYRSSDIDHIQVQEFNVTGTAAGALITFDLVGLFGDSFNEGLAATGLSGGGYAIVWSEWESGFLGTNTKLRLFSSTGTALTPEITVNSSSSGYQDDSAIATLNNGNIAVVWTDSSGNGGDPGKGIKGRIFDASGNAVTGEFVVNGTLAGNQQNASMAVLSNGKFVVVWEDWQPGSDDTDGCIRGQIFAEDGTKLGGEFLVNTPAPDMQLDPEVIALENGKFAVEWDNHLQIFNAGDIVAPVIGTLSANTAQEYAANGAVVGTVAASDASAITYSLVNDAGGRFVINAATGQVTVADGLLLDFEQAATHAIRVRVVDASLNATEQDFTINIVNRTPEFVVGDTRANTFVGGAGTDNLSGGEGGDLLDGGLGADNLRGGLGDDRYYVDNSGDVVTEFAGQGSDTVFTTVSFALAAGSEVETLRTGNAAGTGAINLTGNGFANTLLGNAGNNRLDGKSGADIMRGFGGNDLYFVDNSADTIIELATGGTDTAVASASYALGAGVHVETLQTANPTGTVAINLTGNELGNVIRGNLGANVLRGNGGGDSLYAGADAVRDSFVYGAQADSAIGTHDMMFNFVKQAFAGDPNSDKIDLRPIDADDDLAGNQAFRFVSAFVAPVGNQAEGQVMVQTLGADTKVLIDLKGDNAADLQIIVKAVTGLTAGDFWL